MSLFLSIAPQKWNTSLKQYSIEGNYKIQRYPFFSPLLSHLKKKVNKPAQNSIQWKNRLKIERFEIFRQAKNNPGETARLFAQELFMKILIKKIFFFVAVKNSSFLF